MAGMLEKFKELINPSDDFEDDEFEHEESGYEEENSNEINTVREESYSPSLFKKSNKIVNMNSRSQLQVVVYKPVSFGEDTRAIALSLMEKHAVVLNLEKSPKDESRRILDFLSGVALAQNGKINKIATATYMIAPANVDLTGDEIFDEFENSGYYF